MSKKTIFFLCLFFGYFGVHRFAEKKIGTGILWLLTCGIYFFGWIYDIVRTYRAAYPYDPEKAQLKKQLREQRRIEMMARIQAQKQVSQDGVPHCPRCKSIHLTAHKKGYGLVKGVAGAALVGPFGLLAGGIGKNKILVTCLNCGHQFKAGKR